MKWQFDFNGICGFMIWQATMKKQCYQLLPILLSTLIKDFINLWRLKIFEQIISSLRQMIPFFLQIDLQWQDKNIEISLCLIYNNIDIIIE